MKIKKGQNAAFWPKNGQIAAFWPLFSKNQYVKLFSKKKGKIFFLQKNGQKAAI